MISKNSRYFYVLAIFLFFHLFASLHANEHYFALLNSENSFASVRKNLLKNSGSVSHRLDSKTVICNCSESNMEFLKINNKISFYSNKKIEINEFNFPDSAEKNIKIWNIFFEKKSALDSNLISKRLNLKDIEEKVIVASDEYILSDSTEGKPYQAYDSQTSSYAIGKISVSVIFPESNGSVDASTENWTQTEIDNVKAQVISAMDKITMQNPDARLTFIYDYPTNPNTSALSATTDSKYEGIIRSNFDTDFLNNILNNLGFFGSSGSQLLREFVHARREFNEADWGFTIIVKDNYITGGGRPSAYINGPAMCIFADTTDNIIMHETCHIFGALDEYHPDAAVSPISMTGYLYFVNANSQYNDNNGYNAGAGEGHPAIMVDNSNYFSPYTLGALGWIDSDSDGTPDIIDTFPSITINSLTGDSALFCQGSAAVTPYISFQENSNSTNTISDVEYRINKGIWLKAQASDGEFSSATENYEFTTPQLISGDYLIEVRANNSVNNWSKNYAYRLYSIQNSPISDRVPFSTIKISPVTGSVATDFLFKALCSDLDDNNNILQVRWDWNNDNVWDTPFDIKKFKWHTFNTSGLHTVKCEVKNSAGNTTVTSKNITVTTSNNPPIAFFNLEGTFDSFGGISHSFTFEAQNSFDPENNKNIQFRWDWESDGQWDTDFSSNSKAVHDYKLYDYSFSLKSLDDAYINIPGYGTTISDNHIFIASGSYGINVFDITDPENPSFVKTISNSNAYDVQVSGNHLYCSSENSGFTVYDINPVTAANAVNTYTENYVSDLEIDSNYLIAACGFSGIKFFDISIPETPALANTISMTQSNYSLKTDNNLLFILTTNGLLSVYDYSDINNILLKSTLNLYPSSNSIPLNMVVKDNLLFAGLSFEDLKIIDFSNPLSLSVRSSISDINSNFIAMAENTLILQKGSKNDITAINISNPDASYISGFYGVNFNLIRSAVYKNQYLFFTTAAHNLGVIKTAPNSPTMSKQWKVTLQVKDHSGLTSDCSRFIWANPYNNRPATNFTVNPASGSPSTNFLFNAAASSDADFSNNWDNMKLYRWDFDGNGNFDTPFSAENVNLYHNYPLSGVYTAICQVRDRFRAISEYKQQVIVSIDGTGNPPQAAFTISNTSPSLNQIVTFNASSSTDPDGGTDGLSYIWDFEDDGIWDTVTSNNSITTWAYEQSGIYNVKLRVLDSTGLIGELTTSITVSTSVNGPYSEITFPENGAILTTPSVISGIASDNTDTISLIEIRIMRDGPFYLRSDGVWTSSETWFEPSGGTSSSWSHDISGVTFEKSISYLVKSRVTNSLGEIELPGSGITFIIGTMTGPQSVCSGQSISEVDNINIAVTSENPSALVTLWYKKSTDTIYLNSNLKITGSGSINYTFPDKGTYNFYTSSSYNGAIEPTPQSPDFTSTYRTDLPIAQNIKLTYAETNYWFQLNEIEIYGSTTTEEPTKIQIDSVTTSSTGYQGYDKSKIIDGLKNFNNDFAVSNPTLPLTITITLAKPSFISSVYHYNDGQYGASAVKVETDGLSNMTQWTTFGQFSGLNLTENSVNLDYLSLTSKIVINEVYLGSSGFIELYNSGTTSVNINQWKLKLEALEIELPNTSISGGAFYVILFGSGTSDATKFYVSQQFPWNYTDSGSVGLLKSSGDGIDFVRWGLNTDSPPAGTAFNDSNPSVPPLGKALGRSLNSEDNDSGNDWTIQNPTQLQKNIDAGKFIISGSLKDENGQPVKSATLTFNGSIQAVSDSNGYYVLTDLDPGNYTIVPSSPTFTFIPSSLQVVLGPDSNNADFQAVPLNNTYYISGWIKNESQGISNVSVSLSDAKTVVTNSDGYYYFPSVSPANYTIVPSKSGYSFSPTSMNVSVVSNSLKEKNFVAIPGSSLYLIRGQIKTAEGSPLPDVSLTCNGVSASSDSSGYFIFSSFTSGEYVITPNKAGYNFSPSTINVTLGPDSESNNFTAIASNVSNKRVRGRYFKLKYTSFNNNTWLQINEIEFFGTTNNDNTSNKLSISQIIPSKETYPGFGVSKLIDNLVVSNGDFAVNISGVNQFEFVFDMGQEVIIDKIVHQNDLTYGALQTELLVSSSNLSGPFDSIQTFNDLTINNQGPGKDILFFTAGKVIINEISLDSDGYIEFYNSGTTDINLTGWTFTGGDKNYTFPVSYLNKGEFILLKNGSGVDSEKIKYLFDQFNWTPGVSGSTALKDESGKGIDFVRWGTSIIMPPSGTFWTGTNPSPPSSGQSLSRNFTFVDTDASSDFMFLTPSPGTVNYQSFIVSGYVKNSSLQAVSGVSVKIENHGSLLTDSNGKFTTTLKPGSYNIFPIKEGYNFSPQIKTINVVNTYISDCNFSAAGGANVFIVSGYIKDSSGNPVGNVSITTKNSLTATSSDTTGFWAIANIPAGNYELTPLKEGISFSPPVYQITIGPSRANIDFSINQSIAADLVYVDSEAFSQIEDGTLSNPFHTISNAVFSSPEGAKIKVHAGVYNESFQLKSNQHLTGDGAFNTFVNGEGYENVVTLGPGSNINKIGIYGGTTGVYSQGSDAELKNITISNCNNGLILTGAVMSLKNCVVTNTTDDCITINSGSFFSCNSCIITSITQNGGTLSNIDYTNIISGGYGVALGTGNISSNPYFNNSVARDFRLQSSSPCINAGSPANDDNDDNDTRNDMGVFGGKDPAELIEKVLPIGIYTSYQAFPGYTKDKLADNKKIYNSDYALKINSDDFSIIYDFGKDISLEKIILFNDGSYGAKNAELLYASNSSSNVFNRVALYENLVLNVGVPNKNILTFDSVQGRYFKIVIKKFNNPNWFQLNEIECYQKSTLEGAEPNLYIQPFDAQTNISAFPGYELSKTYNDEIFFNNQFAVKNSGNQIVLSYDMGLDVSVSKILHYNDGQYGANAVSLSYATENESSLFIDVNTFSNLTIIPDRPNEDIFTFQEIKARYFKFVYNSFNNAEWFQLSEIRFSGVTETAEKISPVSITSIPDAYPGFGTAKLFNNQKIYNSDFACRNNTSSTILTIDLGTDKTFNLIKNYNDGNFGALKCNIDASLSATPNQFTNIINDYALVTADSKTAVTDIRFSSQTARFVKITFTSFKNNTWFQLNEIEFYNQNSSESNSQTPLFSKALPVEVTPYPIALPLEKKKTRVYLNKLIKPSTINIVYLKLQYTSKNLTKIKQIFKEKFDKLTFKQSNLFIFNFIEINNIDKLFDLIENNYIFHVLSDSILFDSRFDTFKSTIKTDLLVNHINLFHDVQKIKIKSKINFEKSINKSINYILYKYLVTKKSHILKKNIPKEYYKLIYPAFSPTYFEYYGEIDYNALANKLNFELTTQNFKTLNKNYKRILNCVYLLDKIKEKYLIDKNISLKSMDIIIKKIQSVDIDNYNKIMLLLEAILKNLKIR